MSLGIAVSVPEGLVLSADTRVTLTRGNLRVDFDNASKLFVLNDRVAAVTYGAGSIAGRTIHSLIPDAKIYIENQADSESFNVRDYAIALHNFFSSYWAGHGNPAGEDQVWFLVAGINPGEVYGEHYTVGPLGSGGVDPPNARFGMRWGGQTDIVLRLINGYAPALSPRLEDKDRGKVAMPIPFDSLPLQDAVDLTIFLTRATIAMQGFSVLSRGVGGMIEVLTITPQEGIQWIQKREIHGENG